MPTLDQSTCRPSSRALPIEIPPIDDHTLVECGHRDIELAHRLDHIAHISRDDGRSDLDVERATRAIDIDHSECTLMVACCTRSRNARSIVDALLASRIHPLDDGIELEVRLRSW